MIGRLRINILRPFVMVGLLIVGPNLFAQDAKFQATVSSNTVGEGDRFRVEFKLNASGDAFQPPRFEGFRILSGPNQSTNMQFVNGRSSYSISFSYVLMALKEGSYTIAPASIKVGSDVVESNELIVNVVKGNPPPQNQSGNQGGNQGAQSKKNADDNLFIKAFVSKASPFVGEQMIATYKLYFNYNIVDNSFTTLPSLTGFWSEDLDVQGARSETEVIEGVRYNVATLKQTILIPQRSGDLVVDPLEMDLVIQQPVQSRSRSLFDQFFGQYKNVKVSVRSQPITVRVRALPAGRPASFEGAVGDFKMTLKADRTEVKANDAINVSYEISGRGNLKLLNDPKIQFPTDFEVYDPKVNDNITTNAGGMSGKRTYTYLTIPRHKGEFDIEPVAFTYFDPAKERYVTLTSDPLRFAIEKGEEEAGGAVNFSNTNKEEVKLLGSDIRYIKTETNLLPMSYSFFGSFWHYLLWLLPFPLFFLVLFIKRRVLALRSDEVYMRKSKANKMAVKRLSEAKKLMSSGDDKKFYEEVFKALYGFFSDKFNIATSELNKETIAEMLIKNGIDEGLRTRAEDILNKCEMARFAPVSDISHEAVYNESVEVISSIQKELK